MACYAFSVLNRWFSSVYIGAGSEPSVNQMTTQVVIASSVTPKDVNNAILSQDTTYASCAAHSCALTAHHCAQLRKTAHHCVMLRKQGMLIER